PSSEGNPPRAPSHPKKPSMDKSSAGSAPARPDQPRPVTTAPRPRPSADRHPRPRKEPGQAAEPASGRQNTPARTTRSLSGQPGPGNDHPNSPAGSRLSGEAL